MVDRARAGEGYDVASPLDQFVIKPIIPIQVAGADFSFTNASLWMAISVICVYTLVMLGTRQAALVPGRLQSVVELGYEFVASMIRDNAGREGMKYFPIIFSLFMFILFGNMLGMIPGSFTFTSHIIVTFFMAICVFLAVTVIGFMKHGLHFLTLVTPPGAPKAIWPLLVPVEVLSYCVRPISLSVRLFCNMLAGLTMMKVFATFAVALGIFGFAPLLIIVALTGLKILVAFLQAYIFTVLTCVYLHDALHLH